MGVDTGDECGTRPGRPDRDRRSSARPVPRLPKLGRFLPKLGICPGGEIGETRWLEGSVGETP